MNPLDKFICAVYVDLDITSDNIANRDVERQRFCDEVRRRTARNDSNEDIVRRLITIRKNGKLPTIR